MIEATAPRSAAQLPRNAKLAIARYEAASDDRIKALGERRLTSLGTVWYPADLTDAVDVLHKAWRQLGECQGAWYDMIRMRCLKASRCHPAGLKPATTPRNTVMWPWLQTADLELQGVVMIQVLDRYEIPLPTDTRDLFMAAWFTAGMDR